ncbi:ATP-binding protein [Flavobacterium sp. ASW18X]|uniref:ATP-binding protein n=1 Tax=Flavobacterium sp. ASW18X TaxID=2572595 RepID=UPI0010AE51D4|nr:ATP-binding protein [Flavobacterium sp. ASW18X]TKD66035.1 PAS domain-containing protein [Flavobacterium sp. ASW18X]
MPTRALDRSNKAQTFAMLVAFTVLLAVFIFSYIRYYKLDDDRLASSELFKEQVQAEKLFNTYNELQITQLQSSFVKQRVPVEKFQSLIEKCQQILNQLNKNFKDDPLQKKHIDLIQKQHDSLLKAFTKLDLVVEAENSNSEDVRRLFKEMNGILYNIDNAKDNIIAFQQHKVQESENNLQRSNRYYAILFFAAGFISLLISILAFVRITKDNKHIVRTTEFLESVLEATEEIANLYLPVYNDEGDVVDFRIDYASKANESVTVFKIEELRGMLVSDVYPFMKKSGELDRLINCFNTQEATNDILDFNIDAARRYFWVRYFPFKDNVKVLVSDVTSNKMYAQDLERLNSELEISNSLLNEAEKIASMGSYIWNLDKEETFLSDNVYRILGYKKGDFDAGPEKFRMFVHPEDLEEYEQQIQEAYELKKPLDFNFRGIKKSGKEVHLYTTGIFDEHSEDRIMVGVIQDISKQVRLNKRLLEQNTVLLKKNTELESFNRVASHDLQEPLRKVQMYLSRVMEGEEKLPERKQQFLERALDGCARMRVLINNLLSFSRIDKRGETFERIDLTTILEGLANDYSLKLEETNSEIILGELPVVRGIPFQMEQLFNNLISNAIKYRKKGEGVIININAAVVHREVAMNDGLMVTMDYHKITVTDNGMGFDNDKREKIFDIFQRLHQKHQYTGTGIGLAICRKIITKHKGKIYAKGFPGEGSTFTVELPVIS